MIFTEEFSISKLILYYDDMCNSVNCNNKSYCTMTENKSYFLSVCLTDWKNDNNQITAVGETRSLDLNGPY